MLRHRVFMGVLGLATCLAVLPAPVRSQTDQTQSAPGAAPAPAPAPSFGPPPLPLAGDIINARNSLSQAQQKDVDDNAKYWMGVLKAGDDKQVFDAKQKLVAPLPPGGAEVFVKAYAAVIAGEAADLYQAQTRPVSRLNGTILLAELAKAGAGAEILPLVQTALTDQNTGGAAVRYWAGSTARAMGQKQSLSAADETKLLADLVAQAKVETEPAALTQELLALVDLNVPPAAEAMLDLVDDRLANLHAKAPAMTLTPELEALRELYLSRVKALANTPNVPDIPALKNLVIRLGVTSFRYMDFAAQVLDSNNKWKPKEDQVQPFELMVLLDDNILQWATEKLDPAQSIKPPKPVSRNVLVNILAVRQTIERWRKDFLPYPPFNFAEEQLKSVKLPQ